MNGYTGSRIPRNIEAKVLDAQSNALNGPTGSRWNMGSLMMQRALLTESELWSLEQQVLVTCSIMEERLLYFSSFCLQTIFFLRKNLIKDNKAPLLELEKNSSVAKSTGHSSRGLELNSKHTYSSTKLFVTPIQGDLMPTSGWYISKH